MLSECVRQARTVLRDLEPHKSLLMQSAMDAAAEEEEGDGCEASAASPNVPGVDSHWPSDALPLQLQVSEEGSNAPFHWPLVWTFVHTPSLLLQVMLDCRSRVSASAYERVRMHMLPEMATAVQVGAGRLGGWAVERVENWLCRTSSPNSTSTSSPLPLCRCSLPRCATPLGTSCPRRMT